MTFGDKIKRILHRKSLSTSGSPSHGGSTVNSSPKSPAKASSSSPKPIVKHGPNNPPNARDPGFRKSFNLGESGREFEETDQVEPNSNSNNNNDDNTSSPASQAQSIPISNGSGKQLMQTLDKYGDDYLGVSPRTHATIPERNLSTVSSIGEETGLGVLPAARQNTSLDGRLSEAREPTKQSVVATSPPTLGLPISQTTTNQSTGGIDETASSIYSEDARSRPSIHKETSSIYTPATSPPPLHPSSLPRPSAHQLQYQSLVSDITSDTEPAKQEPTPQESSRWQGTPAGGEFLAAVKSNFPDTATPTTEPPTLHTQVPHTQEKELPPAAAATLRDPNASIEKQAEAFSDIIAAHVTLRADGKTDHESVDRQAEAFADIVAASIESMKLGMANRVPDQEPDTVSNEPAVSGAGQRPGMVPADSVLEITKAIPGSF